MRTLIPDRHFAASVVAAIPLFFGVAVVGCQRSEPAGGPRNGATTSVPSSPVEPVPTKPVGSAVRKPKNPAPPPRHERLATVAGTFYPADPVVLRRQVRAFLAGQPRVVRRSPRILLVPHAGYSHSGSVAAAAFRQVAAPFDRVVLLAANHDGRVSYSGVSVDRAGAYRGPGFTIPVAAVVLRLLGRVPFADVPAAHAMHMVEVELPFLRAIARGPLSIVPMVAGTLDRAKLEALVGELAELAAPRTLFVFSIDLSHYQRYREATKRDRACLGSLVRRDRPAIARCDTDGTQLLLAMDALAHKLRLRPRLITYANSGDTGGDRSRVVGYGALVYE